uniref:Candidate secreted effector n=1 Tax=Meloidogyne incognita TaxID=6306 RepID=A0A914P0Y5_MELIC
MCLSRIGQIAYGGFALASVGLILGSIFTPGSMASGCIQFTARSDWPIAPIKYGTVCFCLSTLK